jgi:hypothetical protein
VNVLLVNVDSLIPNLALAKIAMHHRLRGDRVRQVRDCTGSGLPYPLFIDGYDMIYVSCVFRWNAESCRKWKGVASHIGGSGYSLKVSLPSEIEVLKPKISMGFITRGCIRKCPWCVVPEKEGKIHQVCNVYDLWDGKSKSLVIMDNNILALPKVFFETCRALKKEGLKVDWNQGLDHRLLTDKICRELLSLKYTSASGSKIRFAFDHISYKRSVLRALAMLKKHGMQPWRTRWYVYVGVDDTRDTVLERLRILREWKQAAFLMRDRDPRVMSNEEYNRMYLWTVRVNLFASVPYDEYTRAPTRPNYLFA